MLSLSDNNEADVIEGFKHLTLPEDIYVTCLILTILISNKW